MPVKLYLLQRLSALVMAPLVLIHLAVMIYAVRTGLDAESILGRTRGSIFWGLIYGSFVVAVSIHAAIGLRTIAHEWFRIQGKALELLMWIMGMVLFLLGMRAVYAVVMA